MLFDFQKLPNINDWYELSDTVRPKGKSSALLQLQNYGNKQIGIFYSSLKHQIAGNCFASVRINVNLNLKGYEYLSLKCEGYGNATTYKVILTQSNRYYPNPTFEQSFEVCLGIF